MEAIPESSIDFLLGPPHEEPREIETDAETQVFDPTELESDHMDSFAERWGWIPHPAICADARRLDALVEVLTSMH